MTRESQPRQLVELPIADVIAQTDAIAAKEREQQIDIINERSFAAGVLLRRLSLQKNELTDTEIENDELVAAIQILLGEMGVDAALNVRKVKAITVDEQTARLLPDRIKQHRQSLGLTQTEYGNKYGVSRYVVFRAEKGMGDGAIRLASLAFADLETVGDNE